jgi:hypothetical protein
MRVHTLVSLIAGGWWRRFAVVTTLWVDSFASAQLSAARMGNVDTGGKPTSADQSAHRHRHQDAPHSGGRPVDAHDKMTGRHNRMSNSHDEMNGRHRGISTVPVDQTLRLFYGCCVSCASTIAAGRR